MVEVLRERRLEREAFLERVVGMLEGDGRVVAAWLFGSLGRGTEDDLSDLDLWVVVKDEAIAEFVAGCRACAALPGEPALILEAPQNAPLNGAYLMALYPSESGPHEVDWYWQPQSEAQIPNEARVLFDKVGLPHSGLPALVTSTGPQTQEEKVRAAGERATFFWAMLPIIAKKIVRRQLWAVLTMMNMVLGTLEEAKRLMDWQETPSGFDEPPPTTPEAQLERLRRMGSEMEAVMRRIQEAGGAAPIEIVPQVARFFEVAEDLIRSEEGVGQA